MSTTSVATVVVSLRLGAMTGRFGSFALLITAYACYVISMLAAPLAPSLLILVGPSLLFGVGNGLNIPTLQSALAGSVEPEVRAAVMALNGMALRGGQTIGPLLAGIAFLSGGLGAVFILGAGVAVAMIGLAFLFLRRVGVS
jgi:MFS family permease